MIDEKEGFKKIENAVSIGGDGEEMIETTAWGDKPYYYPNNEETREAFKDVFKVEIPEEQFEKSRKESFIDWSGRNDKSNNREEVR